MPSGSNVKGIRKFEFVAKTQFNRFINNNRYRTLDLEIFFSRFRVFFHNNPGAEA